MKKVIGWMMVGFIALPLFLWIFMVVDIFKNEYRSPINDPDEARLERYNELLKSSY